ncbi:MAG TPA: cytochrome c biogenesis heme-transporting ATPase CcmA [Pyrinomonadaceae bacterium]|nr:cytochrome c biogenesis heme-transporting ATPase CcmA [Pyrinomonadaceae bacterium]
MPTILEVKNLRCVRGERLLFTNVNFSLAPGGFLQLTGPNGSGKTSLLRIVCGLMTPEWGEIRWQGAHIRSLGEEYSRAISYLGHRNAVKEELSSLENLRISSGLSGCEITRDQAQEALAFVGLGGRENLPARFLSEGQRRRLAVARLITCKTPLWVLDEVLASLDHAAATLIESLIDKHLSKGGLAIVATHQELHISASSFQRLELEPAIAGGTGSLG